VGLTNPHNPTVKAYAIVQLRQDNALGTLYNMVGFQTKLKYGEQAALLPHHPRARERRIRAPRRAAPQHLSSTPPSSARRTLRLKAMPRLRFAGQITGCEGYVESAAVGLLAGRFAAAERLGRDCGTCRTRRRSARSSTTSPAGTSKRSTRAALVPADERQFRALPAAGKPYQEVASLNPMTLESITGGQTAYGPIIGAYRLENGDRVYRHAANVESSESSVDVGIFMQRRSAQSRYRLAYFRVGPDGIVKDWATGALPGERVGCTAYAAGIFRTCTSDAEIRQSMAVYDSLVRTSANLPLSAWGVNAGEIEIGSAEMAGG
jgi:hypothetical protein